MTTSNYAYNFCFSRLRPFGRSATVFRASLSNVSRLSAVTRAHHERFRVFHPFRFQYRLARRRPPQHFSSDHHRGVGTIVLSFRPLILRRDSRLVPVDTARFVARSDPFNFQAFRDNATFRESISFDDRLRPSLATTVFRTRVSRSFFSRPCIGRRSMSAGTPRTECPTDDQFGRYRRRPFSRHSRSRPPSRLSRPPDVPTTTVFAFECVSRPHV